MRARRTSVLGGVGFVLCSFSILSGQAPPTEAAISVPNTLLDKWIPRVQWGAELGVPEESPAMLGQEDHTRVLSERGGVTHVIIHHTGNANDTVRTVWDWHVANPNGRQWPDVGYHFMIDSQGNVYQGRSSILLIGSHTGLANIGTVGIAFLGNFNASVPTDAALDSATALIHWLFAGAGITDPWEQAEHNNAGTQVRLAGHRDYPGHASNDCPGHALYDQLDVLLRTPVAELLSEPVSLDPNAPEISGIKPSQPVAQPTRQWLTILGSGFVAESQVILRIDAGVYPIPAERTEHVNSSRLEIFVGLTEPGTWTAQVVNPDNCQSNCFSFEVAQP